MANPVWLQVIIDSKNEATSDFGKLLANVAYSSTRAQIDSSPTLQKDIVEYVTGTGRFEGRGEGHFTTAGVGAQAAEYHPTGNEVAVGIQRLQGVNEDGRALRSADSAPVIAHEIQHAFDRADLVQVSTRVDPGFPSSSSPYMVWNNLLDEADAQYKQYQVANEIFNQELKNYNSGASTSLPIMRMDSNRVNQIDQWKADASESYRHGITPTPEYLVRAKLAVEIGNKDVPSNSPAVNYLDYYANGGRASQDGSQRILQMEISDISDGKVSVIFSSKGNNPSAYVVYSQNTEQAEGAWTAKNYQPIAPANPSLHSPTTVINGQAVQLSQSVEVNEQGGSAVMDYSQPSQLTVQVQGTGMVIQAEHATVTLAANATATIVGGGNTIHEGDNAQVTLSNTHTSFDVVYANHAAVTLEANSQANVVGSGNTISEGAGSSLGAYGGGNTINTGEGSLTWRSGTHGNFDTINANNAQQGGSTTNGQQTGIFMDGNTQANVVGSNNGISEGAGSSLGAYGGGNTINTGEGSLTWISGTHGNFDTINANGAQQGGTTANGQQTGIFMDINAPNNTPTVQVLTLSPGMQTEVFMATQERTAFRYLLDPIFDGIRRSMRER